MDIPAVDGAGTKNPVVDIELEDYTGKATSGEEPKGKTEYLVTDNGKGHLPVTDSSGKPDHGRMGAAWAALHGGYRGKKYEGPGKTEAIAKLKKLYEEEKMETPSEKAAKALDHLIKMAGFNRPGGRENMKVINARITKAYDGTGDDAGLMFVEGILAAEQADFEGEIMDYATSKPLFKAWNADFAEMTSGKSVGNLRGQHNSKICSGTFVQMDYDDEKKTIPVIAKVIDPIEQEKVRHGAYTSFSIGATYAKKWRDGKYMRWTADPFEGSLVDYGAIPKSRGISYRAADGTEKTIELDGGRRALREAFEVLGKPLSAAQEDKLMDRVEKFAAAQKGLYGVSGFAQLLQQLIYLKDALIYEREAEGDESPVTDRVAEATDELLECLAAYTQEQVSEEIGKKPNKKEQAMELNELVETSKNTPGAVADPAAKAAAAAAAADFTDVTKTPAFKAAVNQILDAVKQASATTAKAAEKCSKTAEECSDEKCMTHKGKAAAAEADKAAKKCDKTAEDCKDDDCADHKAGKAAAKAAAAVVAAPGAEVALKRADIEAMIQTAVKAGVADAAKAAADQAVAPIGEQLEAIGNALKALAGAPAPTRISARAGIAQRTKDEEEAARTGEETEEEATKSIKSDVAAGKTVSAVMKLRERPNFVTTGR